MDGTVSCWGYNDFGQLGASSSDQCPLNTNLACSKSPISVQGLTSVAQLAGGGVHTCALKTDGSVLCWGSNAKGQLGAKSKDACGSNATPCSLTPVVVAGLSAVVELDAGGSHTCARKADGTVLCWGWNEQGQLGDGTTTDHATPTPVKW